MVQVDDLTVEGKELDDIELADGFFFGCREGGPGGRKTGAFARLFCPVTIGGQVCHLLSVFDEYAHSANCYGHDNIRLAGEPLYGIHPISNGVNPALPLPAPDLRWSGSGAYLAPPLPQKEVGRLAAATPSAPLTPADFRRPTFNNWQDWLDSIRSPGPSGCNDLVRSLLCCLPNHDRPDPVGRIGGSSGHTPFFVGGLAIVD